MRLSIPLVLLAVLLLVSVPAWADPIPITTLFNTGVASDGTPLPDGAADPHYTLVSSPGGAFLGSTYTLNSESLAILIPGFWTPNTSTSKWIAPSPDPIIESYPHEFGGNYIYRTSFSLPSTFDPLTDTALITGQWASDNTGVDILINGMSTGNSILYGCEFGPCSFQVFTPLSINTGFQAGINALDFIVWQPGGNYTGIHAQMTGQYDLFPPGPPPWPPGPPPWNPVPEPSTLALMGLGLVGLIGYGSRHRAR